MSLPRIGMLLAFFLFVVAADARAEMMPGAIGNDGANGFDGSISVVVSSVVEPASGRDGPAAINGAGLSIDGAHTAPEYGNEVSWLSSSSDLTGYFAVNLGGAYELDHLQFWNFQGLARSNRGIKTADIYVSTFATPANYDFANNSEWTLLIDNQTFTEAPEREDIDFSQIVDLLDTNARWVGFDIQSNYGGGFTGLSEVQFFGAVVPEPSTWLLSLFAIGAALIVGRLR